MSDEAEWVSITDAAARLSEAGDVIDRSSLSRYVSQHGEALETRRDGRANLVEFGALCRHRAENIRLQSPHAGGTNVETQRGKPASGMTQSLRRDGRTQSDGLARKALADAELREMTLAEKRGELTIVSEVDRAARDGIALMMSAFERAIEQEANRVALAYGWNERHARLAFKQFSRQGLDVFHREILDRLDQSRRDADADEKDFDRSVIAAPSELQ